MKVGDFIQWRDQRNYPGLCGIVTRERNQTVGARKRGESREIFVHWLIFPRDYMVGEGWEKIKDVKLLSAYLVDVDEFLSASLVDVEPSFTSLRNINVDFGNTNIIFV